MRLRTLLANFFISAIMLFGAFNSNAQLKKNIDYSGFFDSYYYHQKYSFVVGVNIPFYFGDLCSSLGCTKLSPGFTVGGGIKLWPRVYFGGEFNYFKLGASDEQNNRSYNFSSSNYELLAIGRYYFIEDIIRKHHDLKNKPKLFKPYGTLGIGVNYANPVATGTINDTLYDLNDLEQQNYPKFIMAIPVGIGLQFDISKRVHLIAEGLYRLTFSDYLDGISTTANSSANDAYMSFSVKVQYNPFAKRMKRKVKKIDPETIYVGSSSDSTAASSSPQEPSENTTTKETTTEGNSSEYQEGGAKEYQEGGEESPTEDIIEEETPSESSDEVEKEESTGEQYDEDGFLISEPEEEEEENTEEDSDDGW